MVRKSQHDPDDRAIQYLFNTTSTDKLYGKYDPYQRAYYEMIIKSKVTLVDDKAGTGKTTIAVHAGIDMLRQNRVRKLLYWRFPSDRGESLGFEPGELRNKESKYMVPFYQALAECGLQPEVVGNLMAHGVIEASTDVTLRGINVPSTFVIIDEAQNARNLQQLRLMTTRVFDNSPTVIIGDSNQTDSRVKLYTKAKLNAFQVYQHHFVQKAWAVRCELKHNYRGIVAQWADEVDVTLRELEAMYGV